MSVNDCRLGYTEYDGARYCHEHCGFLEPGVRSMQCDRAPKVVGFPVSASTDTEAPA